MVSILHKSEAANATITNIHAVLRSPIAIAGFSPGSGEQNTEHNALEWSLTTVAVLRFKSNSLRLQKLVPVTHVPADVAHQNSKIAPSFVSHKSTRSDVSLLALPTLLRAENRGVPPGLASRPDC